MTATPITVDYLGLSFDRRPLDAVVAALAAAPAASCITVVTPNVDHIVRLYRRDASPALWTAYRDASLCLCDSRIVARLARLSGLSLPAVPGSDLTARLFERLVPGDRIAMIGGDATTVPALQALRCGIDIVQHIPPMGLVHNPDALAAAAAFAAQAKARFVFIAVGSPQQEFVAQRIRATPGATGVVLCIGASIDFLTGRIARAPLWMQRAGIEWLHRLLSNPRRLWRRYLVEGPRIFALAWRFRRQTR